MSADRRKYLILGLIILALIYGTRLLQGGGEGIASALAGLLKTLPGIILGLTVHEFGHALASDRLGDPTPRRQGRLSLNPFHHIDPFGFAALLLFRFGWGRPVEIDDRYYKKPRRDSFLVSVAGVLMNLVLAVILLALPVRLLLRQGAETGAGVLAEICLNAAYINIVLIIFNLLPISPLDGFQALAALLDLRRQNWYWRFYQAGPLLLLVLVVSGAVDWILQPGVAALFRFLWNLLVS